MERLCIIPARGGSKRIPRKNIKEFLGKPIIAYAIESALASRLFDCVMVSTDDAEIAEIALKYGAKVPFLRSRHTANDHATTLDVIKEVINAYKRRGRKFNEACCLYPCRPMISAEKLKEGQKKLADFDTAFSVVEHQSNALRAMKVIEGKMDFIFPEFAVTRSQDLEPSYLDAGQFYFFKVDTVMKERRLITSNSGGVVLNALEAQDIDDEVDWLLAEIKYKTIHEISG